MNSSDLPPPCEVEIQLRQKLAARWAAPLQSAQRAKAMSRLLGVVQQLPGIGRANHQDYLLALNQTWEWISRNIDEFQASTDSLERDLVKLQGAQRRLSQYTSSLRGAAIFECYLSIRSRSQLR